MTTQEKIAVLVVLVVVAVVYIGAAWLAGTEIAANVRHQPVAPARVAARWVFLVLALAGVALAAYGYIVEPHRLEVSTVRIGCDKLPPGSAPIRIAHLSDVHSEPVGRLEKRLVHEVSRFRPDVICFTGDAANIADGIGVFRRLLADLAKIAPTYGVAGNWDMTNGWADEMFDNTGATRLAGQSVQLTTKGGQKLTIAGADPGDHLQTAGALAQLDASLPTIFLQHYPSGITLLPPDKVDLMLSGHVHGGQVAIPGYGAIVTLSQTGKQYERGLYRVGHTHLYVSRGIGTEGGRLMSIRLFSPPELVLIELVPMNQRGEQESAEQ